MDFALNALGFVLLIVVCVLFRGWVRGRRRRAYERFNRVMNPPAVPAICRQCGTPVTAGAAFCPRCGAALPPPLPGAVAGGESGRKTLVYLVIGALAVLGLLALKASRHSPRGDGPVRIAPLDHRVR
jgi:hypothetical protein